KEMAGEASASERIKKAIERERTWAPVDAGDVKGRVLAALAMSEPFKPFFAALAHSSPKAADTLAEVTGHRLEHEPADPEVTAVFAGLAQVGALLPRLLMPSSKSQNKRRLRRRGK